MQERRNSIANALELRLSCTDPSTYAINQSLLEANTMENQSKLHYHMLP